VLSAPHQLVSPSMVPKQQRPRNSQNMFISRQEVLVSVPGHDYSQMPVPDRGRMPRVATYADTAPGFTAYSPPEAADEFPTFGVDDVFITSQIDSENVDKTRKREAQWSRWMKEVIPSLIRPHLSLLRQSASLRSISRTGSADCTCGGSGPRHLKVILVHFESKFSLQGYTAGVRLCVTPVTVSSP
jgi:hypothetical protein